MQLNEIRITDKIARILIAQVTNGFLVGIFPENRDLQKLMQDYVQQFTNLIQGGIDGEEWKNSIQNQIDQALKLNNDDVKILVCKDAIEVMAIIAPLPKGERPTDANKPDLSWFWHPQK